MISFYDQNHKWPVGKVFFFKENIEQIGKVVQVLSRQSWILLKNGKKCPDKFVKASEHTQKMHCINILHISLLSESHQKLINIRQG